MIQPRLRLRWELRSRCETADLSQGAMGTSHLELYSLICAGLFLISLSQLNKTGPSVEGGLGVRTLQSVNTTTGNEVTAQNNFKQVIQDYALSGTNTYNLQYDAAGEVTSRAKVGDGTQTLTWDAWGRLVRVRLRDASNNGSDFTTVYDGLGRRVQSTSQNITGGSPSGNPTSLTYYYDPQVEFLELGYSNNGTRTWKVYGPDVSGIYGGAQGTGGLEAFVDETSGTVTGSINNYFGDSLGTNIAGSYAGHGSVLGGYGLLPGSALDNSTPFAHQWRGHYVDATGFYYLGARYYEPTSGRFISADPLGHATSMSLYDYALGDPVNGIDPDGRSISWAANNLQDPLAAQFKLISSGFDALGDYGVNHGNTFLAGLGGFGSSLSSSLATLSSPDAMLDSTIASYGANLAMFEGNQFDAANATFNPAYRAMTGFTEAWTGMGLSPNNLGQDLSGLDRTGSFFQGLNGTVGTVTLGLGGVSLLNVSALAPAGVDSVATETTALSTYRITTQGETFYHYGYAENAGNFAGGLRPSGFATSLGDLSGVDAQSGLSLPRAESPNAVYTVTPDAGTWIRVNPVTQPQFGQPGGLPEYQFPLGTGPGTVSPPTSIPRR